MAKAVARAQCIAFALFDTQKLIGKNYRFKHSDIRLILHFVHLKTAVFFNERDAEKSNRPEAKVIILVISELRCNAKTKGA